MVVLDGSDVRRHLQLSNKRVLFRFGQRGGTQLFVVANHEDLCLPFAPDLDQLRLGDLGGFVDDKDIKMHIF